MLVARESGLQQLVAEVLAENAPMLALFRKYGFGVQKSAAGVVHVVLDLNGSSAQSS
jgi:ribosomal protein S18 acetylase RimI-like enzyme